VGVVRIEPEPSVKRSQCEQCGGTCHRLHGYVYEDEYAHGIYFVDWCDGDHPRRAAFVTVGLGAFGEGTTSADRLAFGVEWRTDGMTLLDEPARDRPDLLGSFVPRDQALTLESIGHLWHVVDHIVLDDPRLPPVQQWLDHDASS
jgi:hypothetical protein